MTLHVERDGPVTTLIRNRVEARNAMDPDSAEALTAQMQADCERARQVLAEAPDRP